MAYFAAGLTRSTNGWAGTELDLDEIDDVAILADALRDLDEDAETALALIEQEDVYCAIVRVDGPEDPRVFVSDDQARAVSRIAAMLLDEAEPSSLAIDDEAADLNDVDTVDAVDTDGAFDDGHTEDDGDGDDRPADDRGSADDVTPAGDPEIVADLGTSARALVALCGREGTLPGDILAAVCANAGCLDELEALHEG